MKNKTTYKFLYADDYVYKLPFNFIRKIERFFGKISCKHDYITPTGLRSLLQEKDCAKCGKVIKPKIYIDLAKPFSDESIVPFA